MAKVRTAGSNYKISTCWGIGSIVDLWKYLLIYLIFPFFHVFILLHWRRVKKETIMGSALLELVLYNLTLLPNCRPLEIKKKKKNCTQIMKIITDIFRAWIWKLYMASHKYSASLVIPWRKTFYMYKNRYQFPLTS